VTMRDSRTPDSRAPDGAPAPGAGADAVGANGRTGPEVAGVPSVLGVPGIPGGAQTKACEGDASLAKGVHARPRIAEVLASRSPSELEELQRFWIGAGGGDKRDPRRQLDESMQDPAVVEARVRALGRRLNQVLALHLEAPSYQLGLQELVGHKLLAYLSSYDLEASLAVLQRHALLVECVDRRFKTFGARAFAIPEEIGDALLRQQRARRRGVFDVLTLRGYLDRLYDEPQRGRKTAPTRLRELYKMYASETAAVGRIERLEGSLRTLVEKAILQFGGFLPRSLFERMETDLPHWNGSRWRTVLEDSLIGTVERLELSRYGIHHNEEALLVFNEVALAYLRRVAVPGDPDQPHHESSLGVDLVSNISRFIGFILEHNVRFTVRGEIFKTTEKRILQELIPNPGRELTREAVLDFIYDFTRVSGLIESTGERTFALSSAGRLWEQKDLEQKLAALLEFSTEERAVAGDYYHQIRMRRILIRLLKRVEPGTWYDLMYLPFLTRNTYLSSLDQLAVEDYFATRAQGAAYTPMEDPQRLAWNLARWVRSRLYLLGIVDLGYDAADRPVALRLTRFGARLLGAIDGAPVNAAVLGSLVVTPDFEVVLFPTGDDAELVHELDRCCVREKKGETLHFRITDRSVQRALSEGMYLSRILTTLKTQSRTPVPQNVLYSIRDWGHRAGLLHLDEHNVLRGEDPETLRRFQQDPGARAHLRDVVDEKRLQLKTRYSPRRMQGLLRELGFLVELE
jgi:XPB/Ssl2-like helicase family protein